MQEKSGNYGVTHQNRRGSCSCSHDVRILKALLVKSWPVLWLWTLNGFQGKFEQSITDMILGYTNHQIHNVGVTQSHKPIPMGCRNGWFMVAHPIILRNMLKWVVEIIPVYMAVDPTFTPSQPPTSTASIVGGTSLGNTCSSKPGTKRTPFGKDLGGLHWTT